MDDLVVHVREEINVY